MLSDGTRLGVKCQVVGPWGTNSYSLRCPATGRALLIDPGAEPEMLLAMLQGCEPVGILVTHSHVDHVAALRQVREALRVPVLAHRSATAVKADRWLEDGDRVELGEYTLRVYHSPGHTEDSVCYYLEEGNRVFVGDAIFEGGPGHTSSPQAFRVTLRTLRKVILPWPNDTVCYPGHGPSFRLGDQRPAIESFLARDQGDFYGHATWEM